LALVEAVEELRITVMRWRSLEWVEHQVEVAEVSMELSL
jgi:hypothetical protein